MDNDVLVLRNMTITNGDSSTGGGINSAISRMEIYPHRYWHGITARSPIIVPVTAPYPMPREEAFIYPKEASPCETAP